MASSSPIALFFLFLLAASSVVPSRAAIITVDAVRVAGLLVCSATGNPSLLGPTAGGIGGVDVTISCNGTTSNVTTVVTDPSGFFNALLTFVDGFLFDTSAVPCTVSVGLPIANCTILPPTGVLRASVTFLGTIISSVLGVVATVLTGLFIIIPV